MTFLGTFAPYVCAPADALVKYDDDIPATVAAIVGCAVPTGWGTAVNIAQVGVGDTVVVIGCGGVGINAIQGARLAGAVALPTRCYWGAGSARVGRRSDRSQPPSRMPPGPRTVRA